MTPSPRLAILRCAALTLLAVAVIAQAPGCGSDGGGTMGAAGTNGNAGTNGAAGTIGSAGTNGAAGNNATAGTNGNAGTNGTAGTNGSAGTSGAAGRGGTTGQAGTNGTAGTNGAAGRGGTTGQAGTNGQAGRGGTTGQAGTSGAAGTPGTGGVTHTGAWRIMPLGDSITGTTCGPQLLSKELKDNGHGNFIFVGTILNNQSCNGAPTVMSEGHGGYLVTDLVGSGQHAAELPQWCSTDQAEIVLMQFGTNDVWNSRPTQSILDAFTTVLTDLRAVKANVIMFVAQITPLNPSGCTNCESNVVALNAAIPGWATSQSTSASPVYVVDLHSAFNAAQYTPGSTYTADGVHPNAAGGQLIADKWYAALLAHGLP